MSYTPSIRITNKNDYHKTKYVCGRHCGHKKTLLNHDAKCLITFKNITNRFKKKMVCLVFIIRLSLCTIFLFYSSSVIGKF